MRSLYEVYVLFPGHFCVDLFILIWKVLKIVGYNLLADSYCELYLPFFCSRIWLLGKKKNFLMIGPSRASLVD